MPRAFTVDQRNAIASAHFNTYAKLELKDSEGNWVDVSSHFDADFLNRIVLRDSVDQQCWMLRAELAREALGVSLSPLMEGSEANLDSSDEYAPLLDPSRQWRAYAAILEHGDTIESGDWELLCQGTYDIIEMADAPVIVLDGRDLGASLLDCYIEEERTYGDDDNPIPMEDVIQQLLDDNLGVDAITLSTPESPSFVMNRFTIVDMNLMAAINLVASKAAFVCRYRFDASDNFNLTLYAPNRTAVAEDGEEDWTLGPSEYLAVDHAKLDLSGVRCAIQAAYFNESTGTVERVFATNDQSITRYGGPHGLRRPLQIDLSRDTNITTGARAQAFVDAVLLDLESPPFLHGYRTTGFWIAQVGDWGKFPANGVHYDVDQFGGVTAIEHVIERGMCFTTMKVGGQPKGKYRAWVASTAGIRGTPQLRIRNFGEVSRATDSVSYSWTTEGFCEELWLFTSTPAQPVGSDPWPSLAARPTSRFTADTTSATVAIPDNGLITYCVLMPIGLNGTFGQPWRFTVQGEQARLIQRVTQIAKTPTTVTVRVEVANPVGSGDINITYEADGASVSPASGQTLTAASVPTDLAATAAAATAGSYVDFVITRAVENGHVAFTASATDRAADTDSIVVPALDSIGQASIAIDASGAPTLAVDGAAWMASHKYASSTTDFPSEATVLASGTTNNNRQFAAALAHTLALGGSVYVTIIPFSQSGAAGVQGTSFRVKSTRHDFSATKTVAQTFRSLAPTSEGFAIDVGEYEIVNGYVRNTNWASKTLVVIPLEGMLVIPLGVTIIETSAELYQDDVTAVGHSISFWVLRLAGDGTSTTITSVSPTTTGWQTKTASCSESTTGRQYLLRLQLFFDSTGGFGGPAAGAIRGSTWSYTYTMPTSDKAI